MIHELAPGNYYKVKTLFEPLASLPFCMEVLDGYHCGQVFVDQPEQPRTAFLLTRGCWGYLTGDCDNVEFLQVLNEALMNKTFLDENTWGLLLSCPPNGWTKQMNVVCAPRQPIVFPRRHYRAYKLNYDWHANIPNGYTIRQIDKSLLDQVGVELPDDIKEMAGVVDSNTGIKPKVCGFVAMHENQVAAQAMIDCVVGDVGEIGFFTQETHRKRGLATVISAATIEYGLAHGLSAIVWDCYEYNTGSIRIAEKLGLQHEHDHNMYCFHFNEANHLSMAAWHEADRGCYQECLDLCEQVFSQQSNPPELTHVAAARAWAATHAPDKAFAGLNQAIDSGWNYIPDLESSEFNSLRDTPEWQTLLERLHA